MANGSSAQICNTSITGNIAGTYHGGGIYLSDKSTLSLDNTVITGNSAPSGQGGGVLKHQTGATLNILGKTVIKDNTATQGPDVYLRFGTSPINITGALDEEALIGVATASTTNSDTSKSSVITSSLSGNGSINNFFSLTENALGKLNENGEYVLCPMHTISFTDYENGTLTPSSDTGYLWDTITLTVNPSDGYMLKAFTVTSGETEIATTLTGLNTYTFEMPDTNVTITPVFTQTYYVYLDFGTGHEDYAAQYFSEDRIFLLDLTDCYEGPLLTYQMEANTSKVKVGVFENRANQVVQALSEMLKQTVTELFSGTDKINCHYVMPKEGPLESQSAFISWTDSLEHQTLSEDVYDCFSVFWEKPVSSVELTVSSPVCGSTYSVEGSGCSGRSHPCHHRSLRGRRPFRLRRKSLYDR